MAVAASGVGTMSVYVGGTLMELTGKVDLAHGGIIREPVKGPGGVIANRWVEKYEAPTLDIEISDGANVNVAAMKDLTSVPIQVAMRNGKTYLITNGICTGEVKGDLAGGKFSLSYFGDTIKEVTP
jgi:hypothetical protein